jgi:hypothetical protein
MTAAGRGRRLRRAVPRVRAALAGHADRRHPARRGHLYFRIPPGTAAASTSSRWPGIDIRAPGYRTGGYLAGPGSVVDGAEYVIDRDVPAAPLPRWLASLLTSPAPVP